MEWYPILTSSATLMLVPDVIRSEYLGGPHGPVPVSTPPGIEYGLG